MPKIYVYLGIVILFYSNEHEPIHVHGKFQGCESKAEIIIENGKVISIVIQSVKGRKGLSSAVLNDFKVFVESNADKIVEKWIDYFVLHKQVQCEIIDRRIK
ncbi:hypothetical protein BIU88_02465 [Chlorobaculum limnaeum]|uniref:DUF4160 domain-containing protein n=1 Tax=Chlorobaculum limnaeum TaxID=274537 RepID=A0A1D8D111_CHLLM|nr:DUF4160 domain-containing protein [Chlorobaculum limnaeum]AOS83105.1 hypothetical protein BIU88_02465 [Chlorobaculum limnaeum]